MAIARQIAEAVAYAHEKGVTHRDLKPANIKITPDGNVKVLDFGLAKVLEGPKNPDSGLSQLPTGSVPATLEGMILGTAAYMSPEQAKGKPVDKRADIWAFGVVLYELLTGAHLFQRETVSDTLAAVLRDEPDWNQCSTKGAAPPAALSRKRSEAASARHRGYAPVTRDAFGSLQTRRPWLAWGAVAVFLVAFARFPSFISARGHWCPRRFNSRSLHQEACSKALAFAVSPDGRHLAFSATGSDGVARLWIRDLDSLEVRALSNSYPANLRKTPASWYHRSSGLPTVGSLDFNPGANSQKSRSLAARHKHCAMCRGL